MRSRTIVLSLAAMTITCCLTRPVLAQDRMPAISPENYNDGLN